MGPGLNEGSIIDDSEHRRVSEQLQITEIIVGEGKKTVKGALLIVHYDGYLEDGTKFDSSRDKGVPFRFVFGTGRVIKGWDQGLVGMKVGGQRELLVPAHLAYGDRKVGDLIPANSNLMFEVELLDVLVRG